MTAVMIGVDPAKRSHAMAVLDRNENEQAALQVRNDNDGYREMLRLAKRWKLRTWAVEGAGGVGVQLAQRLVADGESVVDVPPKLATRARIFDTATAARTTRVMPGRWLWSRSGPRACVRSSSMTSAWRFGCCRNVDASSCGPGRRP